MSNEKYAAKITPVPTVTDNGVLWGWKAEFTDLSDEKMYPFEGSASAESAEQALKNGVNALRRYTKALDEVSVYQVDLYAPEKEEPAEETPAEPDKEEAAPVEEEKKDDAPAEPEAEKTE